MADASALLRLRSRRRAIVICIALRCWRQLVGSLGLVGDWRIGHGIGVFQLEMTWSSLALWFGCTAIDGVYYLELFTCLDSSPEFSWLLICFFFSRTLLVTDFS